jgi:Na+-translocating ferredoxin:NAD+ oxidoreductase RnfA subunit
MNYKALLKSKTLWFSVILAVLGAIEMQAQIIPEEYRGVALIMIAMVTAVLRFMTTQPVSEK